MTYIGGVTSARGLKPPIVTKDDGKSALQSPLFNLNSIIQAFQPRLPQTLTVATVSCNFKDSNNTITPLTVNRAALWTQPYNSQRSRDLGGLTGPEIPAILPASNKATGDYWGDSRESPGHGLVVLPPPQLLWPNRTHTVCLCLQDY